MDSRKYKCKPVVRYHRSLHAAADNMEWTLLPYMHGQPAVSPLPTNKTLELENLAPQNEAEESQMAVNDSTNDGHTPVSSIPLLPHCITKHDGNTLILVPMPKPTSIHKMDSCKYKCKPVVRYHRSLLTTADNNMEWPLLAYMHGQPAVSPLPTYKNMVELENLAPQNEAEESQMAVNDSTNDGHTPVSRSPLLPHYTITQHDGNTLILVPMPMPMPTSSENVEPCVYFLPVGNVGIAPLPSNEGLNGPDLDLDSQNNTEEDLEEVQSLPSDNWQDNRIHHRTTYSTYEPTKESKLYSRKYKCKTHRRYEKGMQYSMMGLPTLPYMHEI